MKLIYSISHIKRSIELNFSKKIHIIVIHKNINVNNKKVIGRKIRTKSNCIESDSTLYIQSQSRHRYKRLARIEINRESPNICSAH